MSTDPEIFVNHLHDIFGTQDAIHQAAASDGGPPISVFVYQNVPETGMITGITYGLSLCPFPAWQRARPEMIIAVRSADVAWPCAAATFANLFRGEKAFQYGDIYTTDTPLTPDTKMTGFLIFAQSILPEELASVQLNDYRIHFSQFYPIYQEEVAVYQQIGLEAFWKHPDFDMYDISRKPVRS